MFISKKCQYALRAVFELARHYGGTPVSAPHIAKQQAIPCRFLEAILSELRKEGIVTSTRGNQGGYSLAIPPDTLSVLEVIVVIQGQLQTVGCEMTENGTEYCELGPHCPFAPLWNRTHKVLNDVFTSTSFEELLAAQHSV